MTAGLNTPWRCAAIALLLATALVLALYAFAFDGRITGFFRIGDALPVSPRLAGQDVRVFAGQAGYDGQQFLSLALDPFLQDRETLACLDNPRYRLRRILYPLAAHVLSLGEARAVPWAMVGLNLAAVAALVLALAGLFERAGVAPALSLLALAIPGTWVVLAFSTEGLWQSALLAGAVSLHLRRRPAGAAAALMLAALTLEAAILYWPAFALALRIERRSRGMVHLLWAAAPALCWNAWILRRIPGSAAPTGEMQDFGPPFLGLLEKTAALLSSGVTAKAGFETISFGVLVGVFVLLAWTVLRMKREHGVIGFCAAMTGALFLSGNQKLFGYYVDYNRVFLDASVLLLVSLSARVAFVPKLVVMGLSALTSVAFVAAYCLDLI